MKRRVCLGAFAGAHGVRGEVKIRVFTEAEENISAYGPLIAEDGRAFTVKVLRVLKPGLVLARAREIATREQAQAVSGVKLHVDRDALPPAGDGEFYIEDLVGLAVVDEHGASVGRVLAMHDFGAGDIIEIKLVDGKSVFIPFTDDAAPEIDLAAGRVTLNSRYLAQPEPEAEPAPDEAPD